MKTIFRYTGLFLLSFVLSAHSTFATTPVASNTKPAASASCPAVNCDCEFIGSDKWQKLCKAREQFISNECIENAGKPKSYCGLHGPSAFPVATSLQLKDRPKVDSKFNPKSLTQMIDTQSWSLQDDFKVLKEKEQSGNIVDAIRIFGIFRKNAQKHFETQQQIILGHLAKNHEDEAIKFARNYSKPATDLAKQLAVYGDELWQRTFSLEEGNRKKAYKALAFKVSREAATAYERSADLFASGIEYKDAANTWQKASAVSAKLLKWEEATTNKVKYVAYYQQQASARLNRATLYWIMADQMDQATANIETVRSGFSVEEERVLSDSEPKELQATTME